MSVREYLTPTSLGSLGATAALAVFSYAAAFGLNRRYGSSQENKTWLLMWLIWDALIHFLLEGPFIYWSLTGTIQDTDHWTALPWKEYSKVDRRVLTGESTVVSLEAITVVLGGLLCIILVRAVCLNTFYRHWIQIVLCTCELYGGWMYFAPEWITGSPNLTTDNWFHLWVYLIFFNGLWVVVPLLLLCQSWKAMERAFGAGRGFSQSKKNNPRSKKSK